MNPVRLRVVIPTSGARPDLLRRTLASLCRCELPDEFAGVVIVENGRKGGAVDLASEFGSALRSEYLFCEQGNKSAALNLVLEAIEDELVVFLDDDVRVSEDLLMRYSSAARETTGPAFFGGPVGVDYEAVPPQWVHRGLPSSARGWDGTGMGSMDCVFMGCNWAAYARDLRSVGGFNPRYGPGSPVGAVGQETEMQRRLRASGSRPKFVDGARVWHWVPASRSSPEWAIERAYHHGKSQGLEFEGGPTVFGVPRQLVKLIFRQSLREIAAACSFYKPWRFLARRSRKYTLGAIDGWRESSGRGSSTG